ncbi:MAG: diaminopimelate decarboxylase [Planctomycetota bacterium]
MDHFDYRSGELHCDEVPAQALVEEYGTPLYVYSAATIRHHFSVLTDAFAAYPPLICYSVKANSNLSLLALLAELGAGFDVVSGGELQRVQEIGGSPQKVVYAGVGKTDSEIRLALAAGIFLFNVESESELHRISRLAHEAGQIAGVAIRVNPDVDAKTHRYITTGKRENKFGVDLEQARQVFEAAAQLPGVEAQGIHIHLGSQITDTTPFVAGVRRVREFLASLGEIGEAVRWLDIGGGFGVHYRGEEALPADQFAAAIVPELEGSGLGLILEPGRFIMGNAGVLLTRIVTAKGNPERRFLICDAGMNDLVRPALYDSYHRIAPVLGDSSDVDGVKTDVVGPICESGDFLGLDRALPAALSEGDLMAVFSAGAYSYTMASNYNTRPRPAEVLVDGAEHRLIRCRETIDDLLAAERAALREAPQA